MLLGKSDRAPRRGVVGDRAVCGAVAQLGGCGWRVALLLCCTANTLRCCCVDMVRCRVVNMNNATTHMIPADLARAHAVAHAHHQLAMHAAKPTQLHYRYAELIGQVIAALAIGLIVLAASLVTHYGSTATLNEGYVLGSDTSAVQVGVETRGTPGIYGHVGALSYYDGTFNWS